MERPRRRGTVVALALTLTLLTAVWGCEAADREAGEEEGAAPAAGSPGDTGAAPGVLPDSLEPVPELPADTVRVTLTEYHIEMPETLPEGRTVFLVTNAGGMDHSLELAVESPEVRLDPPAAPGETKVLTFVLSRGVWEVYCPIGNHREQGMRLELRVGG